MAPRDLKAEEKKYPAGKYVDMHVHLGQPWNSRGPANGRSDASLDGRPSYRPSLCASADLARIMVYPITPHWVLEQTKPFRDRLIPFCSVDPRTLNLGGKKGITDILSRYVDAGAKGFGEHKWGGKIDDPRNLELFHACGEVGLPVLFHMDNNRNTDVPGLPGLEKVLKEVPNVNFIGHAQGWWASISGDVTQQQMSGYPRTQVAQGGAIDRLMKKYDNIFGELSAGSGANSIRRDLEFGREFLTRNADRILFGTDFLADGQGVPQFELLDSLDLPDDVTAKIFRQNARRLLAL